NRAIGGRICRGNQKALAEIAGSFEQAGYRRYKGVRVADARALIIPKKERTVLDDRASEGKTELVLLAGGLFRTGCIEEIAGIKFLVPQVLPNTSVERVCAG